MATSDHNLRNEITDPSQIVVPLNSNSVRYFQDAAGTIAPADTQVLTFDSASGKWLAAAGGGGGATSLLGLTEFSTDGNSSFILTQPAEDKHCFTVDNNSTSRASFKSGGLTGAQSGINCSTDSGSTVATALFENSGSGQALQLKQFNAGAYAALRIQRTGGGTLIQEWARDAATDYIRWALPAGTINAGAGYTLTMPAAAPALGESLEADASGNLSWVTAGGGGGVANPLTADLDYATFKLFSTTANQPLILEVNGTGAFQLDSAGNARGANAVDMQMDRSSVVEIAQGAYATISGGRKNQAHGTGASIGGGDTNEANAGYATIAGGFGNFSTGNYDFLGGGQGNLLSAGHGVLCGGKGNFNLAGGYGAVLGGQGNKLTTGTHSSILGGLNCDADANYAMSQGKYARALAIQSIALGHGAYTNTAGSLVLGYNSAIAADPTTEVNNHHEIAANGTVTIGRYVDQTAVAGASNIIKLQTVNASNQSNSIGLKAHASMTTTYNLTFPLAAPGAGQSLQSDASGNLTWV